MQKHHLYKPEPFWKYVLWTDEVQMELYGYNHNRNVWRTKVVAFHKKEHISNSGEGYQKKCLASVP